jgi:hypothetical protein
MMNMKNILFAVAGALLAAGGAYAQKKSDTLDHFYVETRVDFVPVIAKATKISDSPVIVDSTQKIPTLNYNINSKKITTTFEVEPIKSATMEGEPLQKLYSSLVKAGIGNYTTPYFEYFFNNQRSKEYSYGARYKFIGSWATLADKGYSGYNDNELELYGKKFLKKHTLWGDAAYYRNVVHTYGYDTSRHRMTSHYTFERYNSLSGRAGLKSHFTDSSKVNHDLRMSFYNFSDFYKSSETNFKAQGEFSGFFEDQNIRGSAGVDFYNNKTASDTFNNTILFLNPSLSMGGEKWSASIGVDLRVDIAEESKFYFFGNFSASYDPFDHILIPYAGLTGGLDRNSYRGLALENPFIVPDIRLMNSNRKYEFFAGLRGSVSSNSSYNARVSYAEVNAMPLFVNDTSEVMQNRFNAVYDTVTVLNIHGELMIQHSEKLKLIMKGDYNIYETEVELKPWHKPQLELAFSANYNLRDKIIVKGDVFVIGKQYARTFSYDSTETKPIVVPKELKGIADVNLGVEYRYSKIMSAWVNFNNIGAVRYYRWNSYPLQRFNVMAGVSFAF